MYKSLIYENPEKHFFFNLSNWPFLKFKNTYFTFRKYVAKDLNDDLISNHISCFDGVLRNAISLAIYMGFKDIYLVGCDYTYSPSQHYHWYENGEGLSRNIQDYQKDFFTIAKKYANITTITLNGKSDILDYITYEDFTKKTLEYKENIQLINEKYLLALKKWEGFKI